VEASREASPTPLRVYGARVAAALFVDRAADGTQLYAPRGELRVDAQDGRLQCHVCGRWYRALASTHVSRAHGLSADAYRELVGLHPRHPLWAPDLSAAQAQRLRERLQREPELRAAMAKGIALARRGELQRKAQALVAERSVSLERERQLKRDGARLGSARAEAYRRRRERAAIAAGFPTLAAYYQRRYRDQRRSVDELARELGCAQSAVRGDLTRLGLGPDRARSHGARWKPAP
jgi:predicted transcriptional regulator